MKRYAVLDTDGVVIRECVSSASPEADHPGLQVVEVPITETVFGKLYQEGAFTGIPPRVSGDHKFSVKEGRWVDQRLVSEIKAAQWAVVRTKRDNLLRETDYTQLIDSPKNKQVWAAYRQALRDITKQNDPMNVVWPVVPSE